jgi:hypothetical protein
MLWWFSQPQYGKPQGLSSFICAPELHGINFQLAIRMHFQYVRLWRTEAWLWLCHSLLSLYEKAAFVTHCSYQQVTEQFEAQMPAD